MVYFDSLNSLRLKLATFADNPLFSALLPYGPKHDNFEVVERYIDIGTSILIGFDKNGIDGLQMDQMIGKTECNVENQNLVVFMAWVSHYKLS